MSNRRDTVKTLGLIGNILGLVGVCMAFFIALIFGGSILFSITEGAPLEYAGFFGIIFIFIFLALIASPIIGFIANSKVDSDVRLAGILYIIASVVGGITNIKGILYIIAGVLCFDIQSGEKDKREKGYEEEFINKNDKYRRNLKY